jgi:hypothetical protein
MTGTKGHFEKGQWVAENEPSVTHTDGNVIDKRFSDATQSLMSSVNDMMKVTHDLVTTGEESIWKKPSGIRKCEIQKSFDEIISPGKRQTG